ncbi:hypothetical protein RJI07_01665 [Mycoplasmatota bacterium WC30]
MVSKYYYKNTWFLWFLIIPLLIVYSSIVSKALSEESSFTDIAMIVMFTIVISYLFIIMLRKPIILVTDDMIKYYYMNIRRKVNFADIKGFEVIPYFNRHQLLIKTDNLIKHRIWLDYLSADVDTIVNDIEKRFKDWELIEKG